MSEVVDIETHDTKLVISEVGTLVTVPLMSAEDPLAVAGGITLVETTVDLTEV